MSFLWMLLIASTVRTHAQTVERTNGPQRLRPKLQQKLAIDSTPFGSIVVLDNRLDTGRFFTFEDGLYPPMTIGFDTAAAIAIRQCLEDPQNRIKRGSVSLVINLRELDIPNLYSRLAPVLKTRRSFGIRMAKAGDTWSYNMRNYILFTADVYYKTGDDRYRKIFTIRKAQVRWGQSFQGSVENALELLLERASISFMKARGMRLRHNKFLNPELKDTSSYIIDKQGRDFTFAEINTNTRTLWPHYAVFNLNGSPIAGRWETFEDLRAANVIPEKVEMRSAKGDSVYQIRSNEKDSADLNEAWGVCDGNDLYIKIAHDRYLRFYRQDTGFYFFVPWSLPDMHALLAGVDYPISDPHNGSTNNLPADLGVAAIYAIMEATETKGVNAKKKKIIAEGLKHDYRYCRIDMDSGDILYDRNWTR